MDLDDILDAVVKIVLIVCLIWLLLYVFGGTILLIAYLISF